MFLGAIVVIAVGILVINYFRSLRQAQVPTTSQKAEQVLPQEHTVANGEHLWAISEKYYGSGYNWVDISKANNLVNPNRLLVGQTLTLPKVETKEVLESPTAKITTNAISGDSYNVVKGDHLWGIAVRAYGDGYQWVKLARENKLKNPNIIYPDQELKLPR